MLWYKKQADVIHRQSKDGSDVVPAQLDIEFDRSIAEGKLNTLLEQASDLGGLEPLISSLNAKCLLFETVFPVNRPSDWELTDEQLGAVVRTVFQARRKIDRIVNSIGQQGLVSGVTDLVYGRKSVEDRLDAFVSLIAADLKKERRAMRDLAAEILHFRDPEGMPLMARWVWDEATASGALREFVRGNDALSEIPIDNRPETFEGARVWFVDILADAGFYRDVPMLIDLVQAQAYADYVRAMSGRIGLIQAEFAQNHHPLELLSKLLGIDSSTGRDSGTPEEPTLH
ncbi:hypothetical protein [Acidihalobacter prosperus]